jgi:phosphatidylglycerophosphate synthase
MLDATARRMLGPVWERLARRLAARGVTAPALTGVGLVLGLGAAVAAALAAWPVALALWLVSRVPDGLDGPVARASGTVSERGGWFDLVADFAVYGAFVVGCGIGQPEARMACLVLLGTYYVNGTALLAFSAAAERRRRARPDERTFHFQRGLAEGTETIVVHALLVLLPGLMAPIAWTFAGVVAVTALQRSREAWRALA